MTGPIGAAKARHPLAEVAARTGLHPPTGAGSVTVRCPMPAHGHPDRTPSMRLYLDDDYFYCFGCGARGDVIQWTRETEGTGVLDAIRILDSGRPLTNAWAHLPPASGHLSRYRASALGEPGQLGHETELPNRDRTSPERVHAALDAAWDYYTYQPLHTRAVTYLTSRGIDVEILEAHTSRPETGHTPAKADGVVQVLRARGFNNDELVDAGLAHRRNGGPVSDFYRQRVLIPVRDDQDQICGVIGRNIGDQDRWPKYKNPPRTAVYDKSVNLYHPLPPPQDRSGQVVVVEGTLDAMAIAVSAIGVGLASQYCPLTQSGKELSEKQLDYVLRIHASPPVLAFDGDAAGRDANLRLADALGRRGRRSVLATLPVEADPASWLAEHGPGGLLVWTRQRVRALHGSGIALDELSHRVRLQSLRTSAEAYLADDHAVGL